jgi:hypothetical protein
MAGNLLSFSGMNVQVVDGSGDTDGAINGLGNLIVGYDENDGGDSKTGSHNIIVGVNHTYTSYGGLIAGYDNRISGIYSSVSGGSSNSAIGIRASVSGGYSNTASANYSSVSGGHTNETTGTYGSVSGGQANEASGWFSSVSGGNNRTAAGNNDWATGQPAARTWRGICSVSPE